MTQPTQQSSHAPKTARDLQWESLLERVGHYAATETARELLRGLRPLPDIESASQAQTRAREALSMLRHDAPLPITSVPSVDELCAHLKRGSAGTSTQLRDAARVIEQAVRLRDHSTHHVTSCPELARVLQCASQLGALRDRIVTAVDEHGELMDSASPGVRNARRALVRHREQLRAASQKLLAKYKNSLSGQFVAERGGRTVLPVRADAPHRVEGMILGSSGSGNSLYIEPAELTELNNRVYVAEAELRREEALVLNELSQLAMGSIPELEAAYDNCIIADCVAAIAHWADACNALPVAFAKSNRLVLRQMRHPLLIGEGQRVVPNDLTLSSSQCLVVSGPNAGGKTVALKCLGLAVWMAQSGLPVPCDATSEVGWFDEVLTDIGDEQSISRSLSTFSAHVTRLSAYLHAARPGCLVLLDEIAGGTDPEEGAALAASILGALSERGAAVAVTTHYERLKQLAAQNESTYVNASVGFDLRTLQPTFELTLGIPGQSSALAVAEHYGIPSEVIERARQTLPRTQVDQQKLLSLLEQERTQLHEMRVAAQSELERQQRLSDEMTRDTEKARQVEQQRLSQEARALTMEVLEARALVRRAKEELRKAHPSSLILRDAERLVSNAASPVTVEGSVTRALSGAEPSTGLDEAELVVGMQVSIPHLKAQGELLTTPSKGTVRVNINGLKMSMPVDKLRTAKPKEPAATIRKQDRYRATHRASPAASEPATSTYSPSRTSDNTCDLRGLRVEHGLEQLDGFIDRMLQTGEPAAFFLHGHGTGAMKDAVREYLNTSPHVSRWEPAQPEDGGDALTVCWL